MMSLMKMFITQVKKIICKIQDYLLLNQLRKKNSASNKKKIAKVLAREKSKNYKRRDSR